MFERRDEFRAWQRRHRNWHAASLRKMHAKLDFLLEHFDTSPSNCDNDSNATSKCEQQTMGSSLGEKMFNEHTNNVQRFPPTQAKKPSHGNQMQPTQGVGNDPATRPAHSHSKTLEGSPSVLEPISSSEEQLSLHPHHGAGWNAKMAKPRSDLHSKLHSGSHIQDALVKSKKSTNASSCSNLLAKSTESKGLDGSHSGTLQSDKLASTNTADLSKAPPLTSGGGPSQKAQRPSDSSSQQGNSDVPSFSGPPLHWVLHQAVKMQIHSPARV